ncbi:MAG TPA: hypothetical protein DEP57_03415 [Selenomonas sp.]|nr:hypothetical protein [Selenomonas sp.]
MKLSKIFGQKGRGVAEYALIIAFVLGLGFILSSVGIKDSIKGVFAQAVAYLKGGAYASALATYGQISNTELKNVENGDRLSLDREALTNLGKKFLGMQKSDLKKLLNNPSDKNLAGGQGASNPFGVILLDYEVGSTGDDGKGVTTKLRYNGGSFNSEDVLEWMKGNYAPDGSHTYNKDHSTSGRYFFSNDTIDKSGAVNGTTPEGTHTATVRGRFAFDSEGRVSAVTLTMTRSINSGGWQRDVCDGLENITVNR